MYSQSAQREREREYLDSTLTLHFDLLLCIQPNDTNAISGDTSLHSAVRVGDAKIVSLLCMYHADMTIPNEEEETPIALALANKDFELIQAMKLNPADFMATPPSLGSHKSDPLGLPTTMPMMRPVNSADEED